MSQHLGNAALHELGRLGEAGRSQLGDRELYCKQNGRIDLFGTRRGISRAMQILARNGRPIGAALYRDNQLLGSRRRLDVIFLLQALPQPLVARQSTRHVSRRNAGAHELLARDLVGRVDLKERTREALGRLGLM